MEANPYTPGAGFMPAYLAGRESQIDHAEMCLASIQKRYPQQSMIYYGLRGVGKTVLLNTIANAAENYGILSAHIEADAEGKFTSNLIIVLQRFAHEISLKETAKAFVQKFMSLIKAFSVHYNMEEKEFALEVDPSAGFMSGVYTSDLTDVMIQIGKIAYHSNDTICIFIDEIQYLSKEELSGLIMAIHRCNQLRLPVMIFCAGLPKILQVVGEACSYSERLFRYEVIGSLSEEEATAAIQIPAQDMGVKYLDEAVKEIVNVTNCYPYFIQEMCSAVWNNTKKKDEISLEDVKNAESLFWRELDNGFFSVRYKRCTAREKAFMTAMVRCGELPCTIANVAKIMRKKVSSISLIRAQLINKGMIYSTSYGEIDFTVPQFDEYIKRINPMLE